MTLVSTPWAGAAVARIFGAAADRTGALVEDLERVGAARALVAVMVGEKASVEGKASAAPVA